MLSLPLCPSLPLFLCPSSPRRLSVSVSLPLRSHFPPAQVPPSGLVSAALPLSGLLAGALLCFSTRCLPTTRPLLCVTAPVSLFSGTERRHSFKDSPVTHTQREVICICTAVCSLGASARGWGLCVGQVLRCCVRGLSPCRHRLWGPWKLRPCSPLSDERPGVSLCRGPGRVGLLTPWSRAGWSPRAVVRDE